MICELYGLMDNYKKKKKYIWNVNRNSMVLFMKVAFMGIDIQGFVTGEKEYVDEIYMNRPVVPLDFVERDEDSIILVADEVPAEHVDIIPNNMMIYWSDALELNQALKCGRVIVYGTGVGADRLCDILSKEEIDVDLYCVTENKDEMVYKGKPIIESVDLEEYGNYSIVVSVITERYRKEILETLSNFQGNVYVEHIVDKIAFMHLNLIQLLELAIREHKEVYLYSPRKQTEKLLVRMLNIYNIEVAGYVYDREMADKDLRSIYSLALEGVENKLIIIDEILPERFVKARRNIELAGFSLDQGNYTGWQWYTASDDNLLGNLKEAFDPLVGFSILYPKGWPGWRMYGRGGEDSVKIMVLGGSTSSEVYHPENWVSRLYYKLQKQEVQITIYNGAHTADDIVDEMLRLLRDIHYLHPQIVISMSGVNNLSYKKCASQFNETRLLSWVQTLAHGKEHCSGIKSNESLYSFWDRNQKLLKIVSDFYGATFFGFLQPMNITMDHMDLWEKSVYEVESAISGAADFAKLADDSSEYINFMRLFEHQKNRYIDMAHYTDKAQEIIADKVYEVILPTIQMIKEK